MKLHWSPRSPYVRKVLITAHEVGLAQRLERVRTVVSPFEAAEALFADNPLNKLPTLVTEDGLALYDSRVICEYLDDAHDGRKLFPRGGTRRLLALRNQALGDGMLDAGLVRMIERWKPEAQRSAELEANNARKVTAALDWLEREIALLTERPFDIGHVAVGTALGYLDFRFGDEPWREGRPRLAEWHAEFEARPSAAACPFEDAS